MAKFITGKELTEAICNIISNAKKDLLIVSPYIKLDDYFKEHLFNKLLANSDLHIFIAFGKNENNPWKSIKKEDFEYFKNFPNVSIIYIPNLHAKYYANEKRGIITSVNLYDYSFDNNVEFGVISENSFLAGNDIDYEAWEETMDIIKNNYAVFVKRPNYKKKLLGKDYVGSEIVLDLTKELISGNLSRKVSVFDFKSEYFVNVENQEEKSLTREEFKIQKKTQSSKYQKFHSATNLGRLKNKSYDEVIKFMKDKEYILDKNTITPKGSKLGLAYKKNKSGTTWNVYPESLSELL
ncbi:phospholipase D family protein [Winogradskyella litorisediminis]|uniref:Phospholipase D family protein n=1 Tax=Winogradskyella litorisediminis TaxID=1156618 RepID=A0ABW3N6Z3_9FLAO